MRIDRLVQKFEQRMRSRIITPSLAWSSIRLWTWLCWWWKKKSMFMVSMLLMKEVSLGNGKAFCSLLGQEQMLQNEQRHLCAGRPVYSDTWKMEMSQPMASVWEEWPFDPECSLYFLLGSWSWFPPCALTWALNKWQLLTNSQRKCLIQEEMANLKSIGFLLWPLVHQVEMNICIFI